MTSEVNMSTVVLGSPVLVQSHAASHTAVIRSLFAYIDSRNWRSLEQLFTEDIAYERPGYPIFQGRARVMRFYRRERMIACGRHEVQRIVVSGGAAACSGRFEGTLKTGAPVDIRFADIYQFAGGRITSRTSYFFVPAV
jgi:uncharacterized protein